MFLQIILWIICIGSAVLLSVVILLQEAKGGGLAEAFGGMGAQTFGVKSSGINKFTAYVAIVFVLSTVLITCMRKNQTVVDFSPPGNGTGTPVQEQPAGPGDSGAGAGGGSEPPSDK